MKSKDMSTMLDEKNGAPFIRKKPTSLTNVVDVKKEKSEGKK